MWVLFGIVQDPLADPFDDLGKSLEVQKVCIIDLDFGVRLGLSMDQVDHHADQMVLFNLPSEVHHSEDHLQHRLVPNLTNLIEMPFIIHFICGLPMEFVL